MHRTIRRLSLTPEGARLFERCSQLVRVADEAPSALQREGGEPYGVLRPSCATSFAEPYVADVVAQFVGRYRKCQVEMCVSNALVELVSERVDVALPIAGALQRSSLVARAARHEESPSELRGQRVGRFPAKAAISRDSSASCLASDRYSFA